MNVSWFNPRSGGELQQGSVASINGKGSLYLGTAPLDQDLDWVVVIQP
jgi:hypothetical protein